MLWVLATLTAAAAQTGRNVAQSGLTRTIGTLGATQVRFVFGLPFALIFLAVLTLVTGEPVARPDLSVVLLAAGGALTQIAGTALMLLTMKSQTFAVTTAWLKTEPVIVALASALVLDEALTLPMMAAIAVAVTGVMVMTIRPGTQGWGDGRAAATGLLAAALFGASALGFRGAITGYDEGGSFLMRATTTLALALTLQALVLLLWQLAFDRKTLAASLAVWRSSLGAGFLGAFASAFWFIAFSLTTATHVRTLALVEVVMAQAVSTLVLRQRTSGRQLLGMGLIVAGVFLLLIQAT